MRSCRVATCTTCACSYYVKYTTTNWIGNATTGEPSYGMGPGFTQSDPETGCCETQALCLSALRQIMQDGSCCVSEAATASTTTTTTTTTRTTSTTQAPACSSSADLSDADLWVAAFSPNQVSNAQDSMRSCRVTGTCTTCACSHYVKYTTTNWTGNATTGEPSYGMGPGFTQSDPETGCCETQALCLSALRQIMQDGSCCVSEAITSSTTTTTATTTIATEAVLLSEASTMQAPACSSSADL